MEAWELKWSSLLEYNATNVSNIVPDLPGVYRISFKSVDGNIYVFYVGKADNLKTRLQQHLLILEPNQCIKKMIQQNSCYFRYARVNNENVRNGAELALYKHYKPQCNSQIPEGPEIEINYE